MKIQPKVGRETSQLKNNKECNITDEIARVGKKIWGKLSLAFQTFWGLEIKKKFSVKTKCNVMNDLPAETHTPLLEA
jgi:hypothetical protein